MYVSKVYAVKPAWLPCWVVGVCLSFLLPAVLAHTSYWLLIALMALVLAVISRQYLWTYLLILCLGIVFGLWRTQILLQQQWPLAQARMSVTVQLTAIDIAHTDQKRTRFLAIVRRPGQAAQTWLISDYQRRAWQAGTCWQVVAQVRPMVGNVNNVGFNQEAWALSNHIVAQASLKSARTPCQTSWSWRHYLIRWRQALTQRWQQQMHVYPQGVALLQALTVGDQAALPAEAWQVFRTLGINHLVSISGLHVGMLAMLFAGLCRQLLRYLPLQLNEPWRYVRATAVLVAVIYSALAGFAVPTQRSMLMLIILALTWHRWHLTAMQLWWLVMAAVLLYDPVAVLSVGFWLSFLLVAALIWAGDGYLYIARFRQAVQAQWAAGLASVVLISYVFGSVAVLSPVVNAVAIPWFTLILVPVALMALCIPWQPLLMFSAWVSEQTMQALYAMAHYAPQYYPAKVPLLLWLWSVLALLILLLPRGLLVRPLCWLILAVSLTYGSPELKQGTAVLTIWDVGQGLAISVDTAQHHLLFDTGTAYAAQSDLVPNLQATGLKQLDALILSHHDADHDGGAQLIRQQFQPRQIWAGQSGAYRFALKSCKAGLNWQWDGVWFEFLNQPTSLATQKNAQSCVLRVVAADKAVMIMGDLPKSGERALVKAYGNNLYSQILILGHHGSRSASDTVFLSHVAPQYAVVSAGFANSYRHPHVQVVQQLARQHITLLRTDGMGGMRTLLSVSAIHWAALKAYQPYWQRKPWWRPAKSVGV